MWMDNAVLNLPKEFWPKFGAQQHPVLFRFFEAKTTVVVLSASNKAEVETHLETCQADKIPILKRKGGGGTVVLSPGCLILTFAFYAKNLYGNKEYFQQINGLWIRALEGLGIENLSQNGISDICIGDKKIAGTSIFRKKHLLVYQGSMLVNSNIPLISKYLKLPSHEPQYRAKRSHEDFLTTLQLAGHKLDMDSLIRHCDEYFKAHVEAALEHDFHKFD